MFFVKKENVSDFQDRCTTAIFLKYNPDIRFTEYIGKNHFIGWSNKENKNVHFYLFNTPKNNEPVGTVFRYNNSKERNDFKYELFDNRFIEEYRFFIDSPYDYICERFFSEEWEKQYKGLFVSDPPEEKLGVLYKYKSNPNESDDDSIRIFNNFISGQLTFVNPSTCNDPFDCECEIPFDEIIPIIIYKARMKTKYSSMTTPELSVAEITKSVKKYIQEHEDKIDITREMFEEMIDSIYRNMNVDNAKKDLIVDNCIKMAMQLRNLKNEFRILCLARNPRDILMWGYYGNSGKGICCGHKSGDIMNGLKTRSHNICFYGDVNYPDTDNRPKFQPKTKDMADDILNFIIECTFTKYKNWRHEDEFRYVIFGEKFSSDYITIDSSIFQIYLGCKWNEVGLYRKMKMNPIPHKLKMHPKRYELT